jgi:TPR repeat protein
MALSFLRRWFTRPDPPNSQSTQPQADSNQADEQFELGQKFAEGEGVAQDYAQAAHWYGRAAAQNHRLAQFNLAKLYAHGQGVLRDEARSLTWITKAAELGDPTAQYTLGVRQHQASRREPTNGAPERRIEALKWVMLSAGQGHRGAQGACEYVALEMTREEVAEGGRRAAAFVCAG